MKYIYINQFQNYVSNDAKNDSMISIAYTSSVSTVPTWFTHISYESQHTYETMRYVHLLCLPYTPITLI